MLNVQDQFLSYVEQLPWRAASDVDLVVIHCTELPDLATARAYGEKILYASGTGNSGHYYIDRDGAIYRYVPGLRIANHVRGYNPRSIGIELVNRGRFPHWWDSHRQTMTEPYPMTQLSSLRELLLRLGQEFPTLHLIGGHEDLDTTRQPASDDPHRDVSRKLDPGPLFPWHEILRDSALQRFKPATQEHADT